MKPRPIWTTTAACALSVAALSGLLSAALAWGCSGDNGQGSGDQGTITHAGSSDGCSVRADGICDILAGESCACVDCQDTAYCIQRRDGGPDCDAAKQHDGVCDPIDDFCVCDDCLRDPYCQDPLQANCADAGACDDYLEGCLCPGCGDAGRCAEDRATHCLADGGGTAACDPGESCACVDCLLERRCACVNDGVCSLFELCTCDDCTAEPHCTNNCVKDGKCDPLQEGCACDDCAVECGLAPADAGADG